MEILIFRENERFGVPHPYIGMHKMVDKGAPVFPYGRKFHFRKNFIFHENSFFQKNHVFTKFAFSRKFMKIDC